MKSGLECASCQLKWIIGRIAVLNRENSYYRATRSVAGMLQDKFYPSANVGSLSNRSIQIVSGLIADAADYFEQIKIGNNQAAHQTLPAAKDFIQSGKTDKDVFERACAIAATGNVSPTGLPSGIFKFKEIENIVNEKGSWPTFQGNVHEAAKKSSHVLYLTDNSGEIGFDSLLLSRLKEMGKKITMVVKEGPFFEDATAEDLQSFGLDTLVDDFFAIRGFFIPDEIPSALRKTFESSDLVISKGTGNFEGLAEETNGKATVFMLKIKCAPIARKVGLDIGSFAVRLDK